jgi:hypothetical protein
MTATLQTQESFRITATAASPSVDLAIGSVASLLGIGPRQAADRLASFPSVLAHQVPGPRARQLSAMLTLLGLRVQLDPVLSRGAALHGLADIALHPAAGADCDALARRLQAVLGPLPCLRARLEVPGGVVLADMTAEAGLDLRKALRRQKGLWITQSDPETAVFDLFSPRSPRLGGLVSRLGLVPCRFSGAAAGAMNLTTGRIVRQAAGPGALLLDRAFQRFDLILQAAPHQSPAELSDFLSTRPATAGLSPVDRRRLPLRVDSDLPRRAAEQFIADYAIMGLEVAAVLRGHLPFAPRQNR